MFETLAISAAEDVGCERQFITAKFALAADLRRIDVDELHDEVSVGAGGRRDEIDLRLALQSHGRGHRGREVRQQVGPTVDEPLANNSRSARNRPWMPSVGNHENERGNGPIGYLAYQTFFALPAATGQTAVTRGLWYAFTAGSMRVISSANDDVAYQDGGDSYVRGYSDGAQKVWLERELAAARRDRNIDWVVICMHQVAVSSADRFNGADLGVREEWLPLFDKYGVDLVVCGHEHHYERSHPLRGRESNATLTPRPAAAAARRCLRINSFSIRPTAA